MDLVYGIATCEQPQWKESLDSWNQHARTSYFAEIVRHKDIIEAYQEIYQRTNEPILAHMHDDLFINETGWDERVLKQFEDPTVGVVGFAGAPGIGHPDMYRQPYVGASLGRVGFKSNLRNAEAHGARFNGECDVAILDGLALFIRRELLDRTGGWPLGTPIGYFMYDAWICLEARRLGYKIRLVGIACDHLSGRSTGLNPNLRADWEASHRYVWDNFKDVLPARV